MFFSMEHHLRLGSVPPTAAQERITRHIDPVSGSQLEQVLTIALAQEVADAWDSGRLFFLSGQDFVDFLRRGVEELVQSCLDRNIVELVTVLTYRLDNSSAHDVPPTVPAQR